MAASVRRRPRRRAPPRRPAPARHRREEGVPAGPGDPTSTRRPPRRRWAGHVHGAAFVEALAAGGAPRAVWSAAPGADWPALLAQAAVATYASGRGALLCVPDGKDVDRVDAALPAALGDGHHVALRADSGPSARYRDFLAVVPGRPARSSSAPAPRPSRRSTTSAWSRSGTTATTCTPSHGRRTPTPARCCSPAPSGRAPPRWSAASRRTVEAEYLLTTGLGPRDRTRRASRCASRVTVGVSGASDRDLARDPRARSERLPKQAWDTIRAALDDGAGARADPAQRLRPEPGLRAVPHAGALHHLLRAAAPLRADASRPPAAGAGARTPPGPAPSAATAGCGRRCAARPAPPRSSAGRSPAPWSGTPAANGCWPSVDAEPAIVVATPGAEPVAEGGYAAVVLLDTWLALARLDLRTQEEALRRWFNAAALVAPGGAGAGRRRPRRAGASRRWCAGTPSGFARREMEERRSAHLPPASRLATITGSPGAVDDALTLLSRPDAAELLGPAPVEGAEADRGEVRAVVRVPRAQGAALSDALGELQRVRSARKLDPVRVQVDPVVLMSRLRSRVVPSPRLPPWPSSPSACSATRSCAAAPPR